jgi:DNA-binding NarL/FixJ family response regulator
VNPSNGFSTQRIALIITRDESLRKDLEEKLTGINPFDSIEIVEDCLLGIEFVRKNKPHVIIFDTEVSVLEVLNALRSIKTICHETHCVVIADHIGYHALLSMVGADKVLYRGFSKGELACSLN